jgi:hypothetical protein
MSILQDISKKLLAVANLPPEQRNGALTEVLIYIEEVQYDMVLEQKNLIMNVIEDLIAENDAEQIAKSKLVFVEDVEQQIAPTKKTRAKKVTKPVAEAESEDLPDYIKAKPMVKDLPEPVRKLIGLRRKEQGNESNINLDSKLTGTLLFDKTLENSDFWFRINDFGDLTEFKKLYGNKGEKVDELIEFAELNEFVENEFLNPVVPEVAETESEDLPDTIDKFTPVKDLPEQVKKLVIFRNKQLNMPYIDLGDSITFAFQWDRTPEGADFWSEVTNLGDLREFKKKYGNKGEGVDAIINAPAVKVSKAKAPKLPKAPAPVVAKQKLIFLRLNFYPPVGSVIKFELYNPTELHFLVVQILSKLNKSDLQLGFEAVTDFSSYLTKVKLYDSNSTNEMVDILMEQFDTFVTPELDWSDFVNNGTDALRIKENGEILDNALKSKSAPVVTSAPAKVVTPKVEKPKPVKVEKPKPTPVVKTKPVKVEKPKPVKVVKPKATKPKAEDDLSFLDDLDNIF